MRAKRVSLFSSTKIGSLELENRLVRSATAERLATDPIGRATPELAALYRDLSRGGVGLIITGHAFVSPEGRAHPEMLSAHCDEMIPGLRMLADIVHAEGGRIAVQINHGGRQCDPACTPLPLAPSAVATQDGRLPSAMDTSQILEAIEAFGQAARRVQEAGFDAVQIHAAHGYLISQFLSPHTNLRTDGWGGDFERRVRFLSSVCEAVRSQVGPDYPVFVKLGMRDNLERVPDGLTEEDGALVVSRLSDLGLDAVEVSGGNGGGADFNTRLAVGSKQPEGYFRSLASKAKGATHLPVIAVGGFRTKSVMEDALSAGDADLISLCRPLIREPQLPRLLKNGQAMASACISGGRCSPERLGQGIRCRCAD